MRTSNNEYGENGRLMNGYDYDRQAWVENGRYVCCGHPETMQCRCYGRLHEGEETVNNKGMTGVSNASLIIATSWARQAARRGK